MRKTSLLLVPAACALLLTGCSSDHAKSYDPNNTSCPSTDAPDNTKTQWTVKGTTGEARIAAGTDKYSPVIDITTPFSVDETQVKTLSTGDGPVVKEGDTVYVCYEGVNGRTGDVFDSSYGHGEAASFPAQEPSATQNGVITGFVKALVGQKGGSHVGVVIPSKDGYAQGSPDGSIKPGDTIVFEMKIARVGD
ncbi:FKBP-type peptidyl-prolyl cis-trans isomerase [Gordonia sp. (in: high G+C Gram-positive bacteria)]|uniref:FKBP-type peptidyl-prolyl cis-trans isomerase n=1 Tax=Gordonia sp. (in: high G+C Gram-positive bacteria) TaxID=84139 RepID=UPI002601B703|nr:FKBP-type peptidyl-prolyl cis-trans isomerase [Gordonia sp. (in: high G+C Gram-positive bacteria)]